MIASALPPWILNVGSKGRKKCVVVPRVVFTTSSSRSATVRPAGVAMVKRFCDRVARPLSSGRQAGALEKTAAVSPAALM